jgi:radical SAM protein with 4Fe4S-binding SPASM domain
MAQPVIWGTPASISIEPTTACNLRCPECPSGLRSFTRPTGTIKEDFFKETIDQLSGTLTHIMFYFQGEPFIHPRFLDMVGYAEKQKIYTITSTNGHFLHAANVNKILDSGLSRLIISVDGTTQETYEAYRKEGRLSIVLDGARRLVAEREKRKLSKPYIVFQFLVVKPNEHQIPEIYRIAREIGVDKVNLKTAQVYDYENGHELIPTREAYSRYKKNKTGRYEIKNKLENQCWKMWHSCVITWDGSVVPCCFDKDASHKLGDLQGDSFHTIWHGHPYQTFRATLLVSRKEIDICKNCTEGMAVFAAE